jgi:hypothetical protein
MTDRTRFVTYQSKQILQLDMSKCSAREVEEIFRGMPDVVLWGPLATGSNPARSLPRLQMPLPRQSTTECQ